MFDGSRELTDEDRELIKLTENKKSIVLVNKLDLEQKIDTDELEKLTGGFINISVKADEGVEKLYDYKRRYKCGQPSSYFRRKK